MCRTEVPTVWLHVGGRSFYCPFCKLSRRHPPFDPFYLMAGHVFCEVCGTFMRIEGERAGPEKLACEGAARGAEGRGPR